MRRYFAMVVLAASFTGCQLPMSSPLASQQGGYTKCIVLIPNQAVPTSVASQSASPASVASHEQTPTPVATAAPEPFPAGYRIAYIPMPQAAPVPNRATNQVTAFYAMGTTQPQIAFNASPPRSEPPQPAAPEITATRQTAPSPSPVVMTGYYNGNVAQSNERMTPLDMTAELCRQMIDLKTKTQEMSEQVAAQAEAQKRAFDLLGFNMLNMRRDLDKLKSDTNPKPSSSSLPKVPQLP